ncbi:MAG: hypothetical protein ABI761_12395, partial [Saprospiraceae bacterium]
AENNLWLVFEKMIKQLKHRSIDKLIEMLAEIPTEDKINHLHSPIEKIKINLENIAREYTYLVDHLPKNAKDTLNYNENTASLPWCRELYNSKIVEPQV